MRLKPPQVLTHSQPLQRDPHSSHTLQELEAHQVNIGLSYYSFLCIPLAYSVSVFVFLDGDLFDEAMDGGQVNVNGRGEDSPDLFDMSALRENLSAPSPRKCQTPEAFLGPTAASLVNLDSLIPPNPAAMNKNPFLSGISCSQIIFFRVTFGTSHAVLGSFNFLWSMLCLYLSQL